MDDPIRYWRQARTDAIQGRDAAEHSIAQRQTICAMVVVEELILELRHVDIGWALGLTRFAFEAKIHHLIQALAGEFLLRNPAGDHVSERIGAPARGMLFVQSAHVRRAHGAVELLAALAHAAAHFDRPRESSLRAEIKRRARLPGFVLRADLERLGHCRGVDDLAGIHEILRIEGALDLAEGIVERRAEELRVE